mgnify:CR=1 FL=1
MKKRDNLPLNYKERLNSRTSFLVSVAVLVVLCLVFNQMDYTMIRQPAAQAKKAADLQKQKEEEAAATTQEVTTAQFLQLGITWFSQVFLHPASQKPAPGIMTVFMLI